MKGAINATAASKKQKLTNFKKAKGKKDSGAAGPSLKQLMTVSQMTHDQSMETIHALVGGKKKKKKKNIAEEDLKE